MSVGLSSPCRVGLACCITCLCAAVRQQSPSDLSHRAHACYARTASIRKIIEQICVSDSYLFTGCTRDVRRRTSPFASPHRRPVSTPVKRHRACMWMQHAGVAAQPVCLYVQYTASQTETVSTLITVNAIPYTVHAHDTEGAARGPWMVDTSCCTCIQCIVHCSPYTPHRQKRPFSPFHKAGARLRRARRSTCSLMCARDTRMARVSRQEGARDRSEG